MITERTQIDRITILDEYKQVQLRTVHIFEQDGTEISRNFSYETLPPDADISNKPNIAKIAASNLWTADIKKKWKDRTKPTRPEGRLRDFLNEARKPNR